MKRLIIVTAEVKYPSSNNTYLSSNSYVADVYDPKHMEKIMDDFKSKVETDEFKIINVIIYIVPQEQIADANR